jgi:hypothetical protein
MHDNGRLTRRNLLTILQTEYETPPSEDYDMNSICLREANASRQIVRPRTCGRVEDDPFYEAMAGREGREAFALETGSERQSTIRCGKWAYRRMGRSQPDFSIFGEADESYVDRAW